MGAVRFIMRSMKTHVWAAPRVMNVREHDVPKVRATGRLLNFFWPAWPTGAINCAVISLHFPARVAASELS